MADESAAEFDAEFDAPANEVRYLRKVDAIREAARKVESILGVHFVKPRYEDEVAFYRTKEDADRRYEWTMERERARLSIGVHLNEDGGTYCPDAFAPEVKDDPWACEPAAWKAAVLDELRVLLRLDETEKEYFEYAISVFRGETLHPAVLADIQ